MKVQFSYLGKQFSEVDHILESIRKVALRGDFTLGKEVEAFEKKFAELCGTKYAVGVNSGTDALFLSLKALGISSGDEVITAPNSFYATVGAIVAAGAKPVFVDVGDDYLINADLIENNITSRTRAIVPVHLTGNICDMYKIMGIAERHGLSVVEDACQAIGASLDRKKAGSFGDMGAFSLHPLKNLNVWGDGGMITTNSDYDYEVLCKLRNHGLKDRNTCEFYAYNSRLSTVQAAVGLEVLKDLEMVTEKRTKFAHYYDALLNFLIKSRSQIRVPERVRHKTQVFHLYMVLAERRDQLLEHLLKNEIEAKIHYPVPLHLQPASRHLGYVRGHFPVCEAQAKRVISLPLHQHMTLEEIDYVVAAIRSFYDFKT